MGGPPLLGAVAAGAPAANVLEVIAELTAQAPRQVPREPAGSPAWKRGRVGCGIEGRGADEDLFVAEESSSGVEDSAPPRVRVHSAPEWEWRRRGPTQRAVRSFGIRSDVLRRLPGGQGHAWTDGRLVAKPVGCLPEHRWVCEVYAGWKCPDVRVPQPVVPRGVDDAGWSVDGWGAHVFVPGREVELPHEIARVREASDAFHDCVRALPCPDFIGARDDPWSFGDRVAWDGVEPESDIGTRGLITALRAHARPVSTPSQMIHGDVLPNVLLDTGSAAAVIDWPPYFRPAGFASAIAVTDAVTFRDAPLSLLDEWATGDDWDQLLVRALVYRLATTGLFAARGLLMGSLITHLARAEPVVEAVLAR